MKTSVLCCMCFKNAYWNLYCWVFLVNDQILSLAMVQKCENKQINKKPQDEKLEKWNVGFFAWLSYISCLLQFQILQNLEYNCESMFNHACCMSVQWTDYLKLLFQILSILFVCVRVSDEEFLLSLLFLPFLFFSPTLPSLHFSNTLSQRSGIICHSCKLNQKWEIGFPNW